MIKPVRVDFMRGVLIGGYFGFSVAAAVLFAGASARADGAPTAPPVQRGFEIALRVGYAPPYGRTDRSHDRLAADLTGQLGFSVDVGYRINERVYAGVFGHYGLVFPACYDEYIAGTCTGFDLRAGVAVQVHLWPRGPIDPWVGVGLGYEYLRWDLDGYFIDNQHSSSSRRFYGFEFGSIQIGADYRVGRHLGIGPFFALTVAQFTHYDAAFANNGSPYHLADDTGDSAHGWVFFGMHAVYDL